MSEETPAFPDYETISVAAAAGIATITLDRPDRLNALNVAMVEEMIDAFDRIDLDDGVRATIVTGAGSAFCAGADLSQGGASFERGDGGFSMAADADDGGRLARRLLDTAKPTIAAINGSAVGIGITMTLPMDFRLMAADARAGFIFVRRGIVPEACSSFFLPRIVGISQALDWVISGRVFGAEEALATGLVRSLHPAGELLDAAAALAAELTAKGAPVAIALSRRMLWRMLNGGPIAAHELDSEALHFLGSSADVVEGVESFLQKRAAEFPMRVSTDMPAFYRRWGREGDGLESSTVAPEDASGETPPSA